MVQARSLSQEVNGKAVKVMVQLLVWYMVEKEAEMKNGGGMGLEELMYVGLDS